jgi:hypothetical protein
MFKQRFIKNKSGLIGLAAVTGSANLLTGSPELASPSPGNERGSGGSSGGGC